MSARDVVRRRLEDDEWLSTWTWRVGVSLVLLYTAVVLGILAQSHIPENPGAGVWLIVMLGKAGVSLTVFGLLVPLARRVADYGQEVSA